MKQNNGTGCHNCKHFTDATESSDEVRWGFCDRYPPTPVATVNDEGEDTVDCVRVWVQLPHKCGECAPVLQ